MKKRSIVTLLLGFVFVFALAFAACAAPKTVEKLELNTENCRVSFVVGETFSAEGLVVTAVYTDGTSDVIPLSECQLSRPNMTVDGTKNITVKYQDVTARYQITVTPEPFIIEWETDFTVDPVGGERYYEMSALDAYIVGEGTGPCKELPDVAVGGFIVGSMLIYRIDALSAGTADLYLSMDHSLATVDKLFKFTLNDEPLEIDEDSKVAKDYGDHAHTNWLCFQDMLIARVNIVKGHNILICEGLANGTNVKGAVLNFQLLDTITLNTDSVKKDYYVDEAFSTAGLVVNAKYLSDLPGEAIDLSKCTISQPDMSTVGEKTVTVTYFGKTAEFKINVTERASALTGITLDTENAKKEFACGESFSYEGLTVTANFEDGSSQEIALDRVTVTAPEDMLSSGQKTVTVAYRGQETTYNVNVTPAFTVNPAADEKVFVLDATKAVLGNGITINKEFGDVGGMNAENKASIYFYFDSEAEGDAQLIFNYDHTNVGGSLVSGHMDIIVNGKTVPSDASFVMPGVDHEHGTTGHCYVAPTFLGVIKVEEGFNTIEFRFKAAATNLKGITLDFNPVEDNPDEPVDYRFEVEDALLSGCMIEFKEGVNSNGHKHGGDMNPGSRVTFKVMAADDATVAIKFRIATPGATTLGALFECFTVNGEEVENYQNVPVPAGVGAQWYWWTMATMEGVQLTKGLNTIIVGALANFDCMVISSTVEITEVEQNFTMIDASKAEYEGIITPVDGKDGWLGDIYTDDTVTFKVNVDKDTTAMLSLFVNDNHRYDGAYSWAKQDVSRMYEFTVNGAVFASSSRLGFCAGPCPDTNFHVIECKIGEIELKANQENVITIKFLNDITNNLNGIGLYCADTVMVIDPPQPDPERVATSITLDTTKVATELIAGTEFSYDGLVVNISFNDGSSERAKAADYTVSVPDMRTTGEKTVTVTYGELTATYKVNVTVKFNCDPEAETKVYTFNAVDAVLGAGVKIDAAQNDVGGIAAANAPSIFFNFMSASEGKAKLLFYYDDYFAGHAVAPHMDIFVNGVQLIFDGNFASPEAGHAHNAWHCFTVATELGTIDIIEGVNIIEFRFKADGTNLKCIALDFTPEEPAPEVHVCNHVCTEPDCGKCTDTTCTDPVCAENRCPGHTPAEGSDQGGTEGGETPAPDTQE